WNVPIRSGRENSGVGPACWISSYFDFGSESIGSIYRPLLWTLGDPDREDPFADIPATGQILWRYCHFAAQADWHWTASQWGDEPRTWEWHPSRRHRPRWG